VANNKTKQKENKSITKRERRGRRRVLKDGKSKYLRAIKQEK
jgi:hypothetical protein